MASGNVRVTTSLARLLAFMRVSDLSAQHINSRAAQGIYQTKSHTEQTTSKYKNPKQNNVFWNCWSSSSNGCNEWNKRWENGEHSHSRWDEVISNFHQDSLNENKMKHKLISIFCQRTNLNSHLFWFSEYPCRKVLKRLKRPIDLWKDYLVQHKHLMSKYNYLCYILIDLHECIALSMWYRTVTN